MNFADTATQNDFLQAVANVRRIGAVLLDWQHLDVAQLNVLAADLAKTHAAFQRITDQLSKASMIIQLIAETEARRAADEVGRAPTEPPPAPVAT